VSDLESRTVAAAVEIRRAVPADLDALLPLVTEFYEIDRHPWDEKMVVGALGPLLDSDEFGQVWVAVRGPALLGYAVVTWGYSLESGGRESLLDEFYVRDRGTGIGSAILTHAFAEAAAAGASRMFLETEAHNSRVRGFYARHGLVEDDSIWMSRDL
jgi:ribosomal protein S18 acetylase RimI-like enzyme